MRVLWTCDVGSLLVFARVRERGVCKQGRSSGASDVCKRQKRGWALSALLGAGCRGSDTCAPLSMGIVTQTVDAASVDNACK